ncbi:MAG: hypothetical protein SOW59_08555 [Corynebacterium sp.]|nr:hypothetical protein [Corynebacterium sp.]
MKKALYIAATIVLIVIVTVITWTTLAKEPTDTPYTAPTTAVTPDEDATDHIHGDPTKPGEDIGHNATMFISTMYSFNPRDDSSPQDAMNRAAEFTTGDLHRAATEHREDYKPSLLWASWEQSGDTVSVAVDAQKITLTGEDTGTVTVWARQIVNAALPLDPFTIDVHLVKVGHIWLAESYELQTGAPVM